MRCAGGRCAVPPRVSSQSNEVARGLKLLRFNLDIDPVSIWVYQADLLSGRNR
jgi:hypothetical protein